MLQTAGSRRSTTLVFILFGLLVVVPAVAAQDSGGGELVGRVIDDRKLPLSGVAVALLTPGGAVARAAITDAGGAFRFVESVLRPELRVQRVVLHRSIVGGEVRPEPLASIRVHDETTGAEYRFQYTDRMEFCLSEIAEFPLPVRVSCYLSQESDDRWVVPGSSYTLSVVLPGGIEATGRTEVPSAFVLMSPSIVSGGGCRLAPNRKRTVYDQELLLALRNGLPAGAAAHLVVAAVDRNYANGVRGGTFSPSGRVRISSISGDGIGLFGSAATQRISIHVGAAGGRTCLS